MRREHTRQPIRGGLVDRSEILERRLRFSEKEISYLKSQRLARIATVSTGLQPDVAAVGFEFDGQHLFIGGLQQKKTYKYKRAHFHKTMSESFFIISGTVQLFNGERWIAATEGDFLYVPEGGVHAFTNQSGEAASMLILFAPGAPREAYFEALAEVAASGRQLTDEEWVELGSRHDNFFT